MKTTPIEPARLERDAHGTPFSSRFDDVYHPPDGAFGQASHVFLAGNRLPERWAGADRFVVLETGFGLGNNFLATWDAWRRDGAATGRLVFISIERHPFGRDDLAALHRGSPVPTLAAQLVDAWPPSTHDLHQLSLDAGRVTLLLAFGDVSDWLPEIVARVDAFYLDGFKPATNPHMWEPRLFKAIGRLAAPGATAATWSSARRVRDGLKAAGFEVERVPGINRKLHVTRARFAPAFTPKRGPSRFPSTAPGDHRALVIGAGLAGCATTWALAELGWRSTLIDRHAAPAQEASGNPAGLFHGIVNGQDGTHSRFNRAAALQARAVIGSALRHRVAGSAEGLIRLESTLDIEGMQRLLSRVGLPPDYVRAIDADGASERSGLALTQPAWFYPGGGWVDPAALARWFVAQAGASTTFMGGVEIARIERVGTRWCAFDRHDAPVAEAGTLVLANASGATKFCGHLAAPLASIRGQISIAATPELVRPRLPVAGSGYLVAAADGRVMFGATASADDADPAVRPGDHLQNLARLKTLIGKVSIDVSALEGRTQWRFTAGDRLPLIGAVPRADAAPHEQVRFIARTEGLYVFTALASRGITWCSLGARMVAAAVSGAPAPVDGSLLDAVDPARFISRAARRPSA